MSAQQLTFSGRVLPDQVADLWRSLSQARGIKGDVVVVAVEQVGPRWTIALLAGRARCAVMHRSDLEAATRDLFTQAYGPEPQAGHP